METPRERALEGLFLGSPIPMLLVDVRSRRITRVNSALGDLLGFLPEDLPGRALTFLDLGDADDLSEHLLLALACGDRSARHRTWRHASGDPLRVDVQATRLHGDRGTLLVLYVRESGPGGEASRKEAQVQERLVRKHEAMARLAVGLAEELRDVSAVAPGTRAGKLLTEFLAFTGQRDLRPRTVSLNRVVEDMEDTLRGGLPQDVGLMVHLCAGGTEVSADPEQLREILIRLVERAHLSMPQGGYAIVGTEAVTLDEAFSRDHPPTQPGPHVVLTVTDTGVALGPEAQRRIFEPFYSTQAEGQGSGLGLATVYGMVKQSGGTIWVTSREGVGTTFRVYLPGVEVQGLDA